LLLLLVLWFAASSLPAYAALPCFSLEQKTAVAVAYVKRGRGLIKLNGAPIELVRPEGMKYKVLEPVLLLGLPRFAMVDIRVRVSGGGYVAQIYGQWRATAEKRAGAVRRRTNSGAVRAGTLSSTL